MTQMLELLQPIARTLLFSSMLLSASTFAQDLVLDSQALSLSGTQTYDSVEIKNGSTLTGGSPGGVHRRW